MTIGIDGRLWNQSGVGRYIRNLVLGINERKVEKDFLIFLTKEIYDKVNFTNPRIRKELSSSRWHTASEQWKFKEEIERSGVDLMHFTYFSYPVLYRRPFVITIHDLILDHFPTGVASSLPAPLYKLKHYGYKKITASAVKKAKKIIVPSIATRDEIINHYNGKLEKIEVIYEGFDGSIKQGSNLKLVTSNFILYVGNAYPHKNLEVLLEAYEVVRKTERIELVCIGRDDFFYEKLKSKKREGVYFLHNVDDSQLFDYYRNAKLFVMPSLMEGFGLPVLEAMHLSCPVLSSNTPALKEVCGEAAIFFEPKNSKELAEKIKQAISNEKILNALAEKGKKQALKFSWDECVTKTLKVYESCNSI